MFVTLTIVGENNILYIILIDFATLIIFMYSKVDQCEVGTKISYHQF